MGAHAGALGEATRLAPLTGLARPELQTNLIAHS